MAVATEQRPSAPLVDAILTCEFQLEPQLALAWVTTLLQAPPPAITPAAYVGLMHARRDLEAACQGSSKIHGPKTLPAKGRVLLQAAFRQATNQNPKWTDVEGSPASKVGQSGSSLWDRLAEELWKSMFEWTNAPGNSTSIGLLFDSLFESLPLAWRVQMQGGKWELFDANAIARRHASGKVARARLPPRMALRVRGVTMKWLTPSSRMVSGALRVPAAGAKSVGEALRLSGVSAMKWIPSEAHSAMKWPARLGGNGFGFVLSVGPSLVNDAIDAGLFHDAGSSANWKEFAIRSADSQTGNLAGYAAGVTAGIALGFAAGAGIAVAAPVAIVIGLAAGIGGQTLFNAFGFNARAKELVTDLVR